MGIRILVVHRNERILNTIQELLQDVGYEVTLTTDCEEALTRAMSAHFDLIIVDRKLTADPEGVQLVGRLRKFAVGAPIITSAPEAAWGAPEALVTEAITR